MKKHLLFLSLMLTSLIVLGQSVTQTEKFYGSDASTYDWMGISSSIFEDWAFVGAPRNETGQMNAGAVYVYHRNNDTWVETQKLSASNSTDITWFGISVKINGDNAIVGAVDWDGPSKGAAYLFHNNNGIWEETAILLASDGENNDFFGISVGLYGDYAIVGAYGYDTESSNAGATYIYHHQNGTWEEQAILTPESPNENDFFGTDVDIQDGDCIIGSPSLFSDSTGYANIYHNEGGTWSLQAVLSASDGDFEDSFGISVDIFDNGAVIGASYDNKTNLYNSGSVYYFSKPATGWENMTETQKIIAPDILGNAYFGDALAVNGNSLAIGAYGDNMFGAVYIFSLVDNNWGFNEKITAVDADFGDYFGSSVALSENYILIGARSDGDFALEAGSVYVYTITATSIENNSENQLSPFPNPTSGLLYFDSGNSSLKKITVTDMLGRVLLKDSSTEKLIKIDLSEYGNGLFFISIKMGENSIVSKILKQ